MWRRFRKPHLQLSRSSRQQQLVCYEESFAVSSLICSHTRNTDFVGCNDIQYEPYSLLYCGTISDSLFTYFDPRHKTTIIICKKLWMMHTVCIADFNSYYSRFCYITILLCSFQQIWRIKLSFSPLSRISCLQAFYNIKYISRLL
jgi:hypothetical protein